MKMKLAIGCDEAAFELKEIIKAFVQEQFAGSIEVTDFGVHSTEPVDYPDIAQKVAEPIREHQKNGGESGSK